MDSSWSKGESSIQHISTRIREGDKASCTQLTFYVAAPSLSIQLHISNTYINACVYTYTYTCHTRQCHSLCSPPVTVLLRPSGEGRSGMGGEQGNSASELYSSPSVPSPSHHVLTIQHVGEEIEEAEAIAWERRREDTSVGMEEHSSQQSLSCLLPQHTHTSPYPVGVQVSGAALTGPLC